jgi:hypothetical protein
MEVTVSLLVESLVGRRAEMWKIRHGQQSRQQIRQW